MAFFTQSAAPRLYIAEPTGNDQGWLAYLLPADVTPPTGIELSEAFPGRALRGSFVFGARAPQVATREQADKVVAGVAAVIAGTPGTRAFLWLTDPDRIDARTVRVMPFDDAGTRVTAGLDAPLADGLGFQVSSGCTLDLPEGGTVLTIQPPWSTAIQFTGSSAPDTSAISQAQVPFTGPQRGCLQFDAAIKRHSLYEELRWGCQFLYPVNQEDRTYLAGWYPLADGDNPVATDMIGFNVSIDPTNIENRWLRDRTYFAFTGQNQDGGRTVLYSYYRTDFGHPIVLIPVGAAEAGGDLRTARLIFAFGTRTGDKGTAFLVTPDGDFTLSVDGVAAGAWLDLLCGLSGTETISFQPGPATGQGDRLRFTAGMPACAALYPFPEVSPVGRPVDPQAPLLDLTFRTSWGTVRRTPAATGDFDGTNHYNAQPKGSSLYGHDDLIHPKFSDMLGFRQPGYLLPQTADFAFPLVPYAGISPVTDGTAFSRDDFQQIESQVAAPTRRSTISAGQARTSASRRASHLGLRAEQPYRVTTPAGLIATVGGDGRWSSVLLGTNLQPPGPSGTPLTMQFTDPDLTLQQAFQTSQLFLVAANANHLGQLAGYQGPRPNAADGGKFFNAINIEDWVITADVGQTNRYGDYNNVLIVKGRTGALRDLVRNPDLWTQKNDFAAPSDLQGPDPQRPGPPDPTELPVLAQWLQDYIAAAEAQDSPYFARFKAIAADPSWTGILLLKTAIAAIPEQLSGLMAGIDRTRFNAHHFGIEISPVNGADISLSDSSAMFGLIYYEDPALSPGSPLVAPAPGADYDFRVLTLKALFENTAVKQFESRAQLTMNKLFDLPVARMGDPTNIYNTILLQGSYQHQNGESFYVLDTLDDNTFYLDSNVLNKVEVVKAQFSTVEATPGNSAARFDLWGWMDFRVLTQQAQGTGSVTGAVQTFDIFSFGNANGADLPRQGLRFAGLGLNMTFPSDNPANRRFAFDVSKITFDVSQSTPRDLSLYHNFALELDSLVAGTDRNKPADMGYLPVVADWRLAGVRGPWYGLRFRLKLGTPGDLAGNVNLISYLLVAFGPSRSSSADAYSVTLGLALPGTGGGAKLLSIQGVLKLSVGDIRLTYVADRKSFLLTLTEIALKFLGLLKLPPNGATSFYLFGNPNADGKASALGWYAVYNQETQQSIRADGREPGIRMVR